MFGATSNITTVIAVYMMHILDTITSALIIIDVVDRDVWYACVC